MEFELRPLSEALGVEVVGLDLRDEQPPRVVEAIVAAWREHHLVLVRTAGLDDEAQGRFASWFGAVTAITPTGARAASYISNTRPEGRARSGPLLKHQDYCFTDSLLAGLSLYAEAIPAIGGETIFVNALLAYERLPLELRSRLDGLHARHVYDPTSDDGTRRYRVADLAGAPVAVHPVVLTHPATGRPLLFVNELMTDAIVELPADESEALLHRLFAVFDDPAITYRHRWELGDVIVWDNIALQHGRGELPEGQPRSLRRMQIA
jgi:alpha-ketoglutarate-dependent taurine dioxygenase